MLQGDINEFLELLGAREGDERLTQAMERIGGDVEVDVWDDRGYEEKYLIMVNGGVTFLLNDGAVHTIFIYQRKSKDQSRYAGWTTLIAGVNADASREQVLEALGEPDDSKDFFLRYRNETGHVQLEFKDDQLSLAVVMVELISPDRGAEDATVPAFAATAVDGSEITGEIREFINALGQPLFSMPHTNLLGLIGPATDSYDDELDGVPMQMEVSGRTGVTLQFRRELMSAVLIELASEDPSDPTYPTPEKLFDGLPLPATRAAIDAYLGATVGDDGEHDSVFYRLGEHYLQVDFENGQSTSVTLIIGAI